jgi:hypothetical protein
MDFERGLLQLKVCCYLVEIIYNVNVQQPEIKMFYVYTHTRNNTGSIFYVGKGKANRLYTKHKRNPMWKNIANKHGFEAKKIADGLDEECAFFVEMEAIALYRLRGYKLANMTDGGEGTSGFSHPHTEEHKQRLKGNKFGQKTWGLTFLGKKHNEEARKKMSDSQVGNSKKKGWVTPDSTKEKLSKARKGVPNLKNRKLTDEQADEIRSKLGYRNIAKLAREYGVGESTIRRIRDGERYKDVV